jgi:hypothetical protein
LFTFLLTFCHHLIMTINVSLYVAPSEGAEVCENHLPKLCK